MYTHTPVFSLSSYGAPLAQRASYLALHSSLFGPVAQLILIILSALLYSGALVMVMVRKRMHADECGV